MLVIFKIKREGAILVVKAVIEGRKVKVTQEPHDSEDYSSRVNLMQHDKDVIISGDTSARAKGRDVYITGLSALKRWKELRHFASMPFKRYRGYRSTPIKPLQALERTRVVWDYLSKYGGGKAAAHKALGMPSEKSNCTLCEYVQFVCSKLTDQGCKDYCPVDWDGFGHKKEGESRMLCYHPDSPYHTFQHLSLYANRHAANNILDLIDLAIRNAE